LAKGGVFYQKDAQVVTASRQTGVTWNRHFTGKPEHNHETARAVGLTFPLSLPGRADA